MTFLERKKPFRKYRPGPIPPGIHHVSTPIPSTSLIQGLSRFGKGLNTLQAPGSWCQIGIPRNWDDGIGAQGDIGTTW